MAVQEREVSLWLTCVTSRLLKHPGQARRLFRKDSNSRRKSHCSQHQKFCSLVSASMDHQASLYGSSGQGAEPEEGVRLDHVILNRALFPQPSSFGPAQTEKLGATNGGFLQTDPQVMAFMEADIDMMIPDIDVSNFNPADFDSIYSLPNGSNGIPLKHRLSLITADTVYKSQL